MKENKLDIIIHNAKIEDLTNAKFYDETVPALFLKFPNPLDDTVSSDKSLEPINPNPSEIVEVNLYNECWDALEFKTLFNNDQSLFNFWLDILSDDNYDIIVNKLIEGELVITDIQTDANYIEVYDNYLKNDKNFEKLIHANYMASLKAITPENQPETRPQPTSQAPQQDYYSISMSNIFSVIDKNIVELKEVIIVNESEIILAATDINRLAELKKRFIFVQKTVDRTIVYKTPEKLSIYICILESI